MTWGRSGSASYLQEILRSFHSLRMTKEEKSSCTPIFPVILSDSEESQTYKKILKSNRRHLENLKFLESDSITIESF